MVVGVVYCPRCGRANAYDSAEFGPESLACGVCGSFLPKTPVRGVIVRPQVWAASRSKRARGEGAQGSLFGGAN